MYCPNVSCFRVISAKLLDIFKYYFFLFYSKWCVSTEGIKDAENRYILIFKIRTVTILLRVDWMFYKSLNFCNVFHIVRYASDSRSRWVYCILWTWVQCIGCIWKFWIYLLSENFIPSTRCRRVYPQTSRAEGVKPDSGSWQCFVAFAILSKFVFFLYLIH